MKDVYIHYGSTHFRPEAFVEPENIGWVKPAGGLWACLKNNDKAYTWKDWNESECFADCSEENSFSFTLKETANIHYIYDDHDLYKLPLLNGLDLRIPSTSYAHINFEQCLNNGIDAIELRYFGDWEKASPSGKLFWKLYGWDCDCILILNPYCIEKEW